MLRAPQKILLELLIKDGEKKRALLMISLAL
jgi:hypothetical protein